MQPGRAVLDRSATNILMFGFGSSRLVFEPAAGRKRVAMKAWSASRAFFCKPCGALTIATDADA